MEIHRKATNPIVSMLKAYFRFTSAIGSADLMRLNAAVLIALGPATALALYVKEDALVLLALLPMLVAFVTTAIVEVNLPELGRYREQVRRQAIPQATFFLVKALHKARAKPWLDRFFLIRPRFANRSLRRYLECELGSVKLTAGALDDSERIFRDLVECGHAGAHAYHNLAILLARRGEMREARHCMHTARALGFALPLLATRVDVWLARHFRFWSFAHRDWVLGVGEFYRQLGLHQAAYDCFKLSDQRDACWKQVTALLAMDRIEEATATVARARKVDPANAMIWLSQSVIESQLGKLDQALKLARVARQYDPLCPVVKQTFYDLEVQLAEGRDLEVLLLKLDDQESDPAVRKSVEALVYAKQERWDICASTALEAMKIGSKWLSLLECSGHAYRHLGVPFTGEQMLLKFCELVDGQRQPLARRQARFDLANEAIRSAWH